MKTDKKQSIYLAASRLFGERGYEGTSLDEVAQIAGVAKGTIFYHFQSKEELFAALIQEGVEHLSDEIEAIAAQEIGSGEKLERIVDFHFDFFHQQRDMCLMILGQMGNFRKRWPQSIELIRSRYLAAMEKVITEAKAAGLVNEELETESLIIALFSLLAVSGIDWALFHPELPEEKMAQTVKTLLMKGLGGK